MDLNATASGLREEEPGFWVASRHEEVFYPDYGHSSCFELEDTSFWFRHRNVCVVSVVQQFPPDGTIVDIGGGNGFVSLGLQNAGFDTLLLEPGSTGARNAFARGLRPVAQATFEEAEFEPQSLCAVGLFDVVEHIEDDGAFLRSTNVALRSQGLLYATVPAFSWLWSPEDAEAGHFRRYTRSSLRSTLQAAGFRVEFSTYLFWPLPLPVFLRRSMAGRLGLRGGRSSELTEREHQAPGGAQGALLGRLLAFELARVARAKRMRFGSSILAVARKG